MTTNTTPQKIPDVIVNDMEWQEPWVRNCTNYRDRSASKERLSQTMASAGRHHKCCCHSSLGLRNRSRLQVITEYHQAVREHRSPLNMSISARTRLSASSSPSRSASRHESRSATQRLDMSSTMMHGSVSSTSRKITKKKKGAKSKKKKATTGLRGSVSHTSLDIRVNDDTDHSRQNSQSHREQYITSKSQYTTNVQNYVNGNLDDSTEEVGIDGNVRVDLDKLLES